MKKFSIAFVCAFTIPYVLLASFIIIFDPYYVFHKPLFNMKPIKTENAHYAAKGLIRNMDYDILLYGTSMCENMHTDYINHVFGGTSAKVIQHGAYSRDFGVSLKHVAWADKADTVIMGLDSTMWKKPSNCYRLDDISDYAVEIPNIINCVPYIFNVDNLKLCLDLIKANRNADMESMNNWWCIGDGAYGKNNLANDWINQKTAGYSLPETDPVLAWQNYNNLAEGIEACRDNDIKIKFFIPPYSVADFSLYDYQNDLKVNKEIWRKLLQYDNVELYAIQFDTELIQNFEYYRNANHYNGYVCDIIIDDISNGKFRLTPDNIDEQVEKFKQFLDEYDWEGLEKKLSVSN